MADVQAYHPVVFDLYLLTLFWDHSPSHRNAIQIHISVLYTYICISTFWHKHNQHTLIANEKYKHGWNCRITLLAYLCFILTRLLLFVLSCKVCWSEGHVLDVQWCGPVAGEAVTDINGWCMHTSHLCSSDPLVLHVSHLLLKWSHRIGEEKARNCLLSVCM